MVNATTAMAILRGASTVLQSMDETDSAQSWGVAGGVLGFFAVAAAGLCFADMFRQHCKKKAANIPNAVLVRGESSPQLVQVAYVSRPPRRF